MDYQAKVDYWRVDDLFKDVNPNDIVISPNERARLHNLFMADMEVEIDSKNLYDTLYANQLVSKELDNFLKPWLYEELKHADAFRKILSLIYHLDESQLYKSMTNHSCDFKPFENLLEDEFKLCVLFAYDECATTIAYRKDSFYQHLGPKAFCTWQRLVIADEARHLKNAVDLIQFKHRHRIKETTKVLEEILATELSAPPTMVPLFLIEMMKLAIINQLLMN